MLDLLVPTAVKSLVTCLGVLVHVRRVLTIAGCPLGPRFALGVHAFCLAIARWFSLVLVSGCLTLLSFACSSFCGARFIQLDFRCAPCVPSCSSTCRLQFYFHGSVLFGSLDSRYRLRFAGSHLSHAMFRLPDVRLSIIIVRLSSHIC